jgi:glycogen debranching enzyme
VVSSPCTPPRDPVSDRSVSVLDGSTFVVSDQRGDIDPVPGRPHGFFSEDTRFVSAWRLTVDDRRPEVLSVADRDFYTAQFFLVPSGGTVHVNPALSVMRRRLVRLVWIEDLRVINHAPDPVRVRVRMELGADFADLFEVKDDAVRPRRVEAEAGADRLVLRYRREDFLRETRIVASQAGTITADAFTYDLELAPDEEWLVRWEMTPHSEQVGRTFFPRANERSLEVAREHVRSDVAEWLARAPRLECDWDPLAHVYRQSLVDLAALRFYPDLGTSAVLPAAGLPWFMTLFGRDSLIASYQALPFYPELAGTTLRTLAAWQGDRDDPFRDQEPGKILHEIRFGELTAFGERPHSPYFGSVDATPLWLILLDEYERWTGDAALVRELEGAARAALEWIERWGDRDGDGYLEYERRNHETGLINQGWKDSWNSTLFADGTLARGPIALCEAQGYAFDARRRAARLARAVWGDLELAARLEHDAVRLRDRVDADFWLPDHGTYALALDGDKRPVDAICSNAGHLLWSGIVPRERVGSVAASLMGLGLWSGWGVRTMAAGQAGYNPLEYHDGTVWPHDGSIIAAGLAACGRREDAGRIAHATWEAAGRFGNRLPEVFAGYERALTVAPVEYPTACRPQAWATAAPLLLIRAVLGLEPGPDGPVADPALPHGVGRLALRGVPGRWGREDVEAYAAER